MNCAQCGCICTLQGKVSGRRWRACLARRHLLPNSLNRPPAQSCKYSLCSIPVEQYYLLRDIVEDGVRAAFSFELRAGIQGLLSLLVHLMGRRLHMFAESLRIKHDAWLLDTTRDDMSTDGCSDAQEGANCILVLVQGSVPTGGSWQIYTWSGLFTAHFGHAMMC